MPEWFPVELAHVWLGDWAWEIGWMVLAGWVAGLISLALTGLKSRK